MESTDNVFSMQAFGPEHPAVAMSLQTLASVLRLRQHLPEARKAVERCVAIRRSNPAMARGLQAAAAVHLHVSDLLGTSGFLLAIQW